MFSTSRKSKIIDILLEQASHEELLAVFQVIKWLLWNYWKKIYTTAVQEILSKEHQLVATVVAILAANDPSNTVLEYINIITAKSHRTSVNLDEHNQSLMYRQGELLYKRSLGRDLEKLLAK